MKFLKGSLLVIAAVAFTVSSAAFMLSYSAISSVSPSLVMDLLDAAGGAQDVVDRILEDQISHMPISKPDRDAILEAAKATLTPATVRDLTGQIISAFRQYLGAGGAETSVLLNFRSLKATFFSEVEKAHPERLDEIERVMDEVPDTADLSGILPVGKVREIARPYRIVTSFPATAATVAVASALLMCISKGVVPGLRVAGWSLAVVAVAVFAATFVGAGEIERLVTKFIHNPDMEGFPIQVDFVALVNGLAAFVLARGRVVSGVCVAAGAALSFLPGLTARKTESDQPSA